jgi:hypothetical protein
MRVSGIGFLENISSSFSIDSMEQIPMLEVGAVLKIHHMVVLVFAGSQCVTVVVGDNKPINTRKVEDMNWVEEDVMAVMVNMRKVNTIEEMEREFETDLSCSQQV